MRRQIGSIRKLGKDCYQVSVTTGYDPETGKQRRKSKVVRGSKRNAEVELQVLAAKHHAETETNLTVEEFVKEKYLPGFEEKVKAGKAKQRTYESYEERLRLHVLPFIGDVELRDLKPSHVRACQDAAATDAMKLEVRKALSAMLKEAVYDGLVPYNPVQSVRPPDRSKYEPEVLDLEDVEVYLWHFRGTRIEPVVLLAIGGAYRRGELAALMVEDINFETGTVTVDDAYVEARAGTLHETPKNHKPRTNKLPRFVIDRLKEILPSSGHIITRPDGGMMKPASIEQLYKRTRDKLPEGVPRITLKNLRHTSLTMAYDATGDLQAVAGHGGHSEAVSKRHYIREHDAQETRLVDAVDEYFAKVVGRVAENN